MKETLKTKLDTFVENKNVIENAFKSRSNALSATAALVFTNAKCEGSENRLHDF